MSRTALHTKLMQALALHRSGHIVEAEKCYREILRLEPEHFDALHMLGAACLQSGRYEEALPLITKALRANPTAYIALNNRGKTLQSLHHYNDALESYDKALIVKPDYEAATRNKADLLQFLDRHEEALVYYDKVLLTNQSDAQIFNNRGVSLQALHRITEAFECYEAALSLEPLNPAILSNKGDALRLLERYEEAIEFYRKALEIDRSFVGALSNCGSTLRQLGRYEEALTCYNRLLVVAPTHVQTLSNRGALLRDILRHEEALMSIDAALTLKPDYVEAWVNRGTVLHEMGRENEALQSYDRALALDPLHADAHWNKALALLAAGYLSMGWREYEWRWKSKGFRSPSRDFGQRQWGGEDIQDGMLRVWGEQGLGDEILYGSMVNDLLTRGLSIILETDKRLVPLFERSFLGVSVIPRSTPPHPSTDISEIRAQISSAGLGQYLRKALPDFSGHGEKFLQEDRALSQRLRTRLLTSGKTRVIGISWLSKNLDFGHHKSCKLRAWEPIFQAAGEQTCFVDLQYGDTEMERNNANLDITHLDDLDPYEDIDSLASLIAACDIVVTVSNTTAHLAGALGVPAWVMVPAAAGNLWYWNLSQEQSPWYSSVTLFRQNGKENSWDDVIARIALCINLGSKDHQ